MVDGRPKANMGHVAALAGAYLAVPSSMYPADRLCDLRWCYRLKAMLPPWHPLLEDCPIRCFCGAPPSGLVLEHGFVCTNYHRFALPNQGVWL